MKKILILIILIISCLFLYGRYIEVNNLKINENVINNKDIPNTFKELKIIHISDILYKDDMLDRLENLTKKVNKQNPDIIIFTGDLFTKEQNYSENDFKTLKTYLKKMNASLYKFAVIGDNDYDYLEDYKDILYESEFVLLDNENKLLFYKDKTPINIIGISDTKDIDNLLNPEIECNYTLAITHKPDNLTNLSQYDIDTILSGHSLGGIINIPYYGGIIKKDGSKTYINDEYTLNNTEIFISNGIGYEKHNFRLFNTPSFNIYRFEN